MQVKEQKGILVLINRIIKNQASKEGSENMIASSINLSQTIKLSMSIINPKNYCKLFLIRTDRKHPNFTIAKNYSELSICRQQQVISKQGEKKTFQDGDSKADVITSLN